MVKYLIIAFLFLQSCFLVKKKLVIEPGEMIFSHSSRNGEITGVYIKDENKIILDSISEVMSNSFVDYKAPEIRLTKSFFDDVNESWYVQITACNGGWYTSYDIPVSVLRSLTEETKFSPDSFTPSGCADGVTAYGDR